jgi:RNA 2',3'-cyclic 3'-phosphodiesterase
MRTFIAIDLPDEIKNALAQLRDRLKKSGADVKWVEPQNIHLTLKFLGEIDEKQLPAIIEIMEEVASGSKEYLLRLSSVGAFPRMESPRVIWVGVDQGDQETKEIALMLENGLSGLGLPKEERPFSSHITIGRVRSVLHKGKLTEELKAAEISEGKEFVVTKMTLFKSSLSPKGPVYDALKETNLKAT